MPATIDDITLSGDATIGTLTQLARQHTSDLLGDRVVWAEGQALELYRRTVEISKDLSDASEIADLWKEAEKVCGEILNIFIKACGQQPDCPTQLSKLFEIKMACHEQEEFHRCD